MTRAYGAPIGQNLDAAYRDEYSRIGGHYPDGFLLWRVEAVRYSICTVLEHGGEDYGATDPRLELFGLGVHNFTEHGATLREYSGARRRWVDLRPGAKQYASRTPREAVEQFARRRRSQIHILRRQLARAERELALTDAC